MISHQTWQNSILVPAMLLLLLLVGGAHAQVVERHLPGNAFAGLTPGPDGRLYGVTYGSASVPSLKGKLYSVDTAMTGAVTHVSFDGATNGAVPYDELVWNQTTGKFYGTATAEGPLGHGTIFSYTPGATTVTVLRADFGI